MEKEKIIKDQNEAIKNHYLIIFISTPIFIGFFYSIFFFFHNKTFTIYNFININIILPNFKIK